MSIPPDSLWRGAASSFPQPVNPDNELEAQYFMASIDVCNIRSTATNTTSLPDVEYRSSAGGIDVSTAVYRYDTRHYGTIFQNGFRSRNDGSTPVDEYCNLNLFVHHGGVPTVSQRNTNYAFVSTTLSRRWTPNVSQKLVYRYEIYAPGGIWIAQTLGQEYGRLQGQDEITFIAGIAPQYIRSAQAFEIISGARSGRRRRIDNVLHMNRNFNPQSHPQVNIPILSPIMLYRDESSNQERQLTFDYIPHEPHQHIEPRQDERQRPEPGQGMQRRLLGIFNTSANGVSTNYYTEGVAHIGSYIDSAFRSTYRNEVYIFMRQKYVLVNYAPGSTNDRILNGPHYIGDSFPSLAGTAFEEYGVDASFRSHRNDEAFIFSTNLCALINFAPRSTKDWIIDGTKTIRQMFPFFRGTSFERGIDAAFESTVTGEAYLFRGSDYTRINYHKKELLAIRPIIVGFHCMRNTVFERDIGAAFASHAPNQAYLFKDNMYVLFHFTPGKNNDYIINGPKEILPSWPSLRPILPVRNIGIDIIGSNSNPGPAAHDEL